MARTAMGVAILMATLGLTAVAYGGDEIAETASCVPECVGDCNGDSQVTVEELLLGTQIAIDDDVVSACRAADANRDCAVTVEELITAHQNAEQGCPTQ